MENNFILWLIITFAGGASLFFYYTWKKNQVDSKIKLNTEGYEHIFHGSRDNFMAFNIAEGRIRFGELFSYNYIERPVSFITNHEWKWDVQDGKKVSNKFLFYLSDINYFMHEVFYYADARKAEIDWAKLQAVINECVSSQYVKMDNMTRNDKYDFFISHASEDKVDFVRPLVDALTSRGIKVWYDEFALEIGDSLRRMIDQGLGKSKYGIVVLSNNFFSKQWPQYELDALVDKSMSGQKVVLPIWNGVNHDDVAKYSHNLADKVAFSTTSLSVSEMADEFLKILQRNS